MPASPPRSPQDDQALSAALFDESDQPPTAKFQDTTAPVDADRLQLRSDLPPDQLSNFLRLVDAEMQNVISGRKKLFDVDQANTELVRLAKLKLQAATQLQQQAAPQTPQMTLAIRGTLQSLSHLAALGNIDAAERLEKTAWQYIESDDPAVALDSQLVLVGLALERLQHGAASDASEILALIDRIAAAPQAPDVSALMVMGQAYSVLQQYGDDKAAQTVRAKIVELFANHPNPNVSAMALEIAGSPKFAGVDELLRQIEKGQAVSAQAWRDAVMTLINDSADMATVQYLASAALQLEVLGQDDLAEATFEVLTRSDRFEKREADEIAIAATARQTRASVIGESVQIDLPSVDGRPLSLQDYAGRVVLMPFWAIAFPDSLAVVQTLDQIRQQSNGQVEIVGMNLDVEDAPANEFLQQSPVRFRSFQSVSSSGAGGNEMAKRFGVVSLPFVVIIGPDAKVAGINMTGQGLAEQVQQLLPQ